jgi:hypothetical protein
VIGSERAFSVLRDKKVETGELSLIDTESRVFAYGFLYQSADPVHFTPTVHHVQQKCVFCALIHKAMRHFKKTVHVRKHQNFERSMRNEQESRGLLLKQYEPARYEDHALVGRKS